jgi:protein-disulfide isomerase
MKFNAIFAAIAVCASLIYGTAAQADDNLSSAQKTQVQTIVHDYLMSNPDVIIQAVQSLQQKQVDAMRTKGETAALKSMKDLNPSAASSDPIDGNKNAKVTVVELFDYQCPHCVDMGPTVAALVKANPDVRIVYKDFPIRGPVSIYAAKGAIAANKQGKYMEFHDELMKGAQGLTNAKVDEIAKTLGLDMKQYASDRDSAATDQQIKATYKLASDIGVMGTPAIFVFKTSNPTTVDFIPGQVDTKYLQDAVSKASK